MKDPMDHEPLPPSLAADLAALADGSLSPERTVALQQEVAASPDLTQAVAQQQRTREAFRALDDQRAPERLHTAIAEMLAAADATATTPARRPWARIRERFSVRVPQLRWSLPTAAVAAAIIAIVIVSGGTPTPTVAEAAQVALRPASAPPPAPDPQTKNLADPVDGVAYPSWSSAGWQAVGARSDVLHERTIKTVTYGNDRGQRIGYAIVVGDALPVDGGRTIERNAVRYRLLATNGATVLTWQRSGHTSILVARGVDAAVLLRLASRPVS